MLMINKMATGEPIMGSVFNHQNPADFVVGSINNPLPNIKKKRNLPGTPGTYVYSWIYFLLFPLLL